VGCSVKAENFHLAPRAFGWWTIVAFDIAPAMASGLPKMIPFST
jgi:hypothetical protein